MKIVGIDEAGRGPVIGPMVMAGVLIDEKLVPKLKDIGVKDSKLLTREQREDLFDKIIDLVEDYKIISVPVKVIDDAVLSQNSNLNFLEADTTAEIINELKPDKAIIDAPSNNIPAYQKYIESKLDQSIELVVEHKADLNYPESGAGSILAKVTRDKAIEKLSKKYGPIGSGYPSDPKTIEFLKKNYKKYPEIFRQSWSSYQNVITKKSQSKLSNFFSSKNQKKIEILKKNGYESIKPTTPYIEAILKKDNTVTFYKKGKVFIQGKNKEKIEKLLKL